MQGLHGPEQVLQWMTDVSGLPIRLIGHLYAMEPPPAVVLPGRQEARRMLVMPTPAWVAGQRSVEVSDSSFRAPVVPVSGS
jgi:hypothetical protein